jgi:hypothetical protein
MIPGVYLFAQEEEPDPIEPEWIDIVSSPYAEGDRNFVITLGILFPTVFVGKEIENNNHGLSIGGTGSLAFNYFWTPNIFLGGEIGGSFSGTRARNMLYIIPFGGRIGYHFLYQRFEFPVTLMVGGAVQRYLERGYFGFIIKPGASVFWRYNPEWSFGFNAAWWFIPQWPTSGQDVYGNFLELTLSARYHF